METHVVGSWQGDIAAAFENPDCYWKIKSRTHFFKLRWCQVYKDSAWGIEPTAANSGQYAIQGLAHSRISKSYNRKLVFAALRSVNLNINRNGIHSGNCTRTYSCQHSIASGYFSQFCGKCFVRKLASVLKLLLMGTVLAGTISALSVEE
jgi:hypothetical protein